MTSSTGSGARVLPGDDEIGAQPVRRAHHGLVRRIVPLGRHADAYTVPSHPLREPLEPCQVGFPRAALDVADAAQTREVTFEIERGVDRLEQHEGGIERAGELRCLAERR